MEKELVRYRGVLKTQNVIYVIVSIVAVVIMVLGYLRLVDTGITESPVGDGWTDMWNGFISGISLAVFGIMIYGIVVNIRALKDEARLKKLFIKEHDERIQAINRYAGHLSYWFETVGLILGTIVGGYFNPLIAFVCLGCLLYICIVRGALTIYYGKKL